MTIRRRLIIAFALIVAMTVFCGVIGIFFVDRIGKSVSVFSEGTSPMLTESLALIDDAQRMRSTFLSAINTIEDVDEVLTRLAALHNDSHARLATLRRLATQPGINFSLDRLDGVEQSFFSLVSSTLAIQRRERVAALVTKQRTAEVTAGRRQFDALLLTLINRAEGKIAKSEDEAKVDVQTGAATVENLGSRFSDLLTQTYPILQNARRLTQESKQISETVDALLQADVQALPALQVTLRNAFKSIDNVAHKLAGRLRDAQGTADMASLRQSIAVFGSAVTSLLASQSDVLAAKSEITAGRNALDQTERLYFNALDEVVQVVRTVNRVAQDDTTKTIALALWIILGSVVLALVAGMTFGIIFARRITRPLAVLADHAEAIRESGELVPITDASVTSPTDEIGKLSRSFNLMIAELASARRRLIDWSETQLRTQYERLDAALNNMSQGLVMIDKDNRIVVCNDRYIEMYGLSREIVKPGVSQDDLFQCRTESGHQFLDSDPISETLLRLNSGKASNFVLKTIDGREISITKQPMSNGGWVSTHEDITERRAAEAQIAYMALHDGLTNLPNRAFFEEQLRDRFAHREQDQKFAVLCFDLDRFKNVNDTLGHQFGDALLRKVAERVRECLREGDLLARLGGDEFAILLAGHIQVGEISALAARLNKVIGSPFDLNGHQAVIGVSIGIAVAPIDAADPEQLLKNADLALYRAKTDGRGTFRLFEPGMDALMQTRRALELDLRKALDNGEFELYYQPLVNLDDGEVSGFEALLRWNHPERGLVSPLDFIPLAEETELIVPIGEWVLREACQEAAKWPGNIRIAVNVSPVQFKSELALVVVSALARSGLAAQRLELEITESVLLFNGAATLATLHQLRAQGVRISMDDFGTGYSSLSYLRSFPFDKIKIDRSFVHNLASDENSMAIIRAVTALGSSLQMSTTGEGVETLEEVDYLKSQGCTEAQGYYFSKPRPASEVSAMLRNRPMDTKAVA